jgi:hypothetical protein
MRSPRSWRPKAPWADRLPDGIVSALDVFAGYVMLDAWIANQDRHHENWAALAEGDVRRLAPTFDHGAPLARNVSDEDRHERMTTRDRNRQIAAFVRRARSAFYEDAMATKPMTTVAAWGEFSRRLPEAGNIWLGRLARIDAGVQQSVLANVPPNRLSKIGRDFTLELLLANQQRLLGGDR